MNALLVYARALRSHVHSDRLRRGARSADPQWHGTATRALPRHAGKGARDRVTPMPELRTTAPSPRRRVKRCGWAGTIR